MNNPFKAGVTAGMAVELAGIVGFVLAWMGLSVLVDAASVYAGAPVDVAEGVAIAVTLPIAGAVLFTGEEDRFRQIGWWILSFVGRGRFQAWRNS